MQDNKKNTVTQPDASNCNAVFDGHTNFDVIMTCQQTESETAVNDSLKHIDTHQRTDQKEFAKNSQNSSNWLRHDSASRGSLRLRN
tara:strand:+ start:444 stop:701 length:258 start_codon:yes stop_codon:yes gene_type:complete